jgi:hypothetical protein
VSGINGNKRRPASKAPKLEPMRLSGLRLFKFLPLTLIKRNSRRCGKRMVTQNKMANTFEKSGGEEDMYRSVLKGPIYVYIHIYVYSGWRSWVKGVGVKEIEVKG